MGLSISHALSCQPTAPTANCIHGNCVNPERLDQSTPGRVRSIHIGHHHKPIVKPFGTYAGLVAFRVQRILGLGSDKLQRGRNDRYELYEPACRMCRLEQLPRTSINLSYDFDERWISDDCARHRCRRV